MIPLIVLLGEHFYFSITIIIHSNYNSQGHLYKILALYNTPHFHQLQSLKSSGEATILPPLPLLLLYQDLHHKNFLKVAKFIMILMSLFLKNKHMIDENLNDLPQNSFLHLSSSNYDKGVSYDGVFLIPTPVV